MQLCEKIMNEYVQKVQFDFLVFLPAKNFLGNGAKQFVDQMHGKHEHH